MFKTHTHIIAVSVFVGLLSGVCSSAFLYLLEKATNFRNEYSFLIWGLPFFGLILGYLIKSIPHHINQGVPYILNELDSHSVNHKQPISAWMMPYIFLSSLGTHLFGGSAGREGVGVIMGASVAHIVPRLKLSYQELRPYLIYTGMAAGFSSIFGTPVAAIVFTFELCQFKDVKSLILVLATSLSSLVAVLVTHFTGIKHLQFPIYFTFDTEIISYVLIASVTSGVGGLIFYGGLKTYTKIISKLIPSIEWKLMVGALVICLIVFLTNGYEYIGIGTDMISKSFQQPMLLYDFAMKCLLTVMTLSIGFKGGEVTPLFFMGATLSNSISSYFSFNNFGLSSSLGMMGLFAAVTATPFATMAMATELFGWKVGVLSIFVCLVARKIMGNRSVYRH